MIFDTSVLLRPFRDSSLLNRLRVDEEIRITSITAYELLRRAVECVRRYELVANEVQHSLAYRLAENDLKPLMERLGIALVAWSPLAKEALAGRSRPTSRAERMDKVFKMASRDEELQRALERVAKGHSATKAVIALAWLIAKGSIPIPGFRKAERVREIAKAAEVSLNREELEFLDSASAKYIDAYGRTYPRSLALRLVPAKL